METNKTQNSTYVNITAKAFLLIIIHLLITACGSSGSSSTSDTVAESNTNTTETTSETTTNATPSETVTKVELFAYPPMAIADLGLITPQGRVFGSHVTPTDHQYWAPKGANFQNPGSDLFDIYAVADGTVTKIETFSENDYRIIINHSDTLYSIYIHIVYLSQALKDVASESSPNLSVKAGDVIGQIGNTSFDYSLHDETVTLPGFILPDQYKSEAWKIHTVDPFDYFEDSIKQQLIAVCPRVVTPLGGKIDLDLDGFAVGNWFVENTNGYAGINSPDYWDTHLSFAYDHFDPTWIRISMGKYDDSTGVFGVKDNTPDPTTISVATGLVKYELVEIDWKLKSTSEFWNRLEYEGELVGFNFDTVKGVVLVQMLDTRSLKFEAFPGKTADQVTAFTSSAVTYER